MKIWSALALGMACAMHGATAGMPTDAAGVEHRLAARVGGDRSGVCLVAAVIDHDKVLRGQGCAGTRKDGPPAEGAAFEIGSVSKTMTAYLVAGLIERGRWSLDDPIAKHLPAGTPLPRQGERQILVRDLLTHSAGLPALPPGMQPADPANPYASLTEEQLLAALGQVQLTRPIGSQAEYSNFGMMVLSLAVARSEGGNLEAALRERLFKPLGMSSAFITGSGAGPVAQGHLPGGVPAKAWTITTNLAGVGMVKASLADMERYARAGLGDGPQDLVARLRRTQQPVGNGFAMGWVRQSLQGHELVMHDGGTGGFSSLVVLEPAQQRAVVLLADTAMTDFGGLGDVGLSLLGLDVPVQPPRRATAAPAALRRELAGDYQLGPMAMRIWEASGDRLMAQAQGQAAFELLHDSVGDFYPVGFAALLRPLPGEAGSPVQRFAWHQGGGVMEAQRVGTAAQAAPVIANPAWRDWAGEFQLTAQFSLRVFEQGGQLMVQGTGQPGIAATPAGKDRIEIAQVGAVVEFERDVEGRVVAAVLRQGGQVLRGVKR